MKKLLPLSFLFFVSCLPAQTKFIDSLKTKLATAKEDTSKIYLYTDIAEELVDIDFKKSIEYAENGLQLAKKLNFERGVAQAYSAYANAYSATSDYQKCLEYNNKALEIRKALKQEQEISSTLNNIGNVYNDQGNFTKALEYYFQCKTIDEKFGNRTSLSQLYNNIGTAYANKGDLKQSITYLFKSYNLKVELGNKKGAANSCNNLAVIYKMLGDFNQSVKYNLQALQYRIQLKDTMGMGFSYANIALSYRNLKLEDSAEINFNRSVKIFSKLGYDKGLATAYNGLGIIHKTQGKYDEALAEYKAAYAIFQKQNDKMGMSIALSNLGSVYSKKKNKEEAKICFEKAEALAREVNSFEVLMSMYDQYSVFYEENGDYKNALKYHLLYTDARDSLRSKENSEAMAEVKTRYETDIKEKENENLKNENQVKDLTIEKKDTQRNVIIAAFIFVIVTGLLLYNRYRLKQKQILAQEQLRQQELSSKAVIEAEEKERVRIARELHDGIGQQLSAAKLNISGLQGVLKTTDANEKLMLQNALDLLDESVKEVRAVSHSMMPNALIKSGLASAVKEFINKISSTGNLKVNLEIIGLDTRLESTTENILFRVLQEIVNNIIKHAKATEISIQLIRHDKELTILAEDNGLGFDVEKQMSGDGGIGLRNIQSRIAFLNGEVIFDSYPGKGTTVTIEIPL